MRTVLCLVPVGAAILFSLACTSKPPFKPVATVKQIMAATVDPSADVVFDAVGTIITQAGVQEIAPKGDEEWAKVRNSALTLAECGNLLMIGDRAKDNADWIRLSQELIDKSMAAAKAADAQKAEALFEAGGDVYAVCEQCHKKYVHDEPKPAGK